MNRKTKQSHSPTEENRQQERTGKETTIQRAVITVAQKIGPQNIYAQQLRQSVKIAKNTATSPRSVKQNRYTE